jgi:hypothetical protein
MEAVLDFGQNRQKLVTILRGREGEGGGAEIDAGQLLLSRLQEGGVRGGGGVQ